MKIGIVGVGSMGSVYAAFLAKAGHEVWAVDIWQEHLDAIAKEGLAVSGASGEYTVQGIQTAAYPSNVGPCDVWIIGTKAADVEGVAAAIVPLLEPASIVMAFQNGLGAGERVARQVPRHHVMVGIAEGFGSSVSLPGQVHHTGMRQIRIGELDGGATDRLDALVEVWRDAGFNVRGFADIDQMIWEKFLCNVTLSAPCAAFDLTVGELMDSPDAWAVAIGAMLEAHRLGVAMGVRFSFDDPVDYVTTFSATIPTASPSMRLDHLARRRSEVDDINGQVVTQSRPLGLPTPYNETLCAILRRREAAFG